MCSRRKITPLLNSKTHTHACTHTHTHLHTHSMGSLWLCLLLGLHLRALVNGIAVPFTKVAPLSCSYNAPVHRLRINRSECFETMSRGVHSNYVEGSAFKNIDWRVPPILIRIALVCSSGRAATVGWSPPPPRAPAMRTHVRLCGLTRSSMHRTTR